ncbi:hypothetical protein GA0070215_10320 [Micromonospora marina]|uniref:Uncharacterized protein n=1 Tax=Micromonospora marina TaxID=307120 RepID=A0A1C4V9Y3_9ACTN|nr:hypothetical protein GA0070215_10320 [Micromonospora marina]
MAVLAHSIRSIDDDVVRMLRAGAGTTYLHTARGRGVSLRPIPAREQITQTPRERDGALSRLDIPARARNTVPLSTCR